MKNGPSLMTQNCRQQKTSHPSQVTVRGFHMWTDQYYSPQNGFESYRETQAGSGVRTHHSSSGPRLRFTTLLPMHRFTTLLSMHPFTALLPMICLSTQCAVHICAWVGTCISHLCVGTGTEIAMSFGTLAPRYLIGRPS